MPAAAAAVALAAPAALPLGLGSPKGVASAKVLNGSMNGMCSPRAYPVSLGSVKVVGTHGDYRTLGVPGRVVQQTPAKTANNQILRMAPPGAQSCGGISPVRPQSPGGRSPQRSPRAVQSPKKAMNSEILRVASEPGAGAARPASGRPDEFVISLGRSAQMPWGLSVLTTELKSNNRLIVEDVKEPSALSEWNKIHPDKRIAAGDQLTEVNGKVDAEGMLQVMKTQQVLHIRVRPLMSPQDLELWLDAARNFELNSDFDISGKLGGGRMGYPALVGVMKSESVGKTTIQAIGDKITLNRLLDNLKVPQMPLLFSARLKTNLFKVQEFVDDLTLADENGDEDAFEVVVKPTHLSSATGALLLSKEKWLADGYGAEKLLEHMEKYLAQHAADTESEALKSLIPGFIAQPRYKSCVDFKAPLEMRVVTLWGKARLGIWWWGRQVVGKEPAKGQKPHRTAWLVRKIGAQGLDNGKDNWENVHEHEGVNKGFDAALQLFLQAMPAMAAAAESIATAIGAPFLRSDFFVGSEKWGVRLNEVAYGSGVDCRRLIEGSEQAVDDGALIARILQEGFDLCHKHPPEHFLAPLGAEGADYNSMVVTKLGKTGSEETKRPRLPSFAVRAFDTAAKDSSIISPVAQGDCDTGSHRLESQRTSAGDGGYAAPNVVQVHRPTPYLPVHSSQRPHLLARHGSTVAAPMRLQSCLVPRATMSGSPRIPGAMQYPSLQHAWNNRLQSPMVLGNSLCCPVAQ